MKLAMVYASVVLLWSTTPLAIKWSNDSLSSIAAVSLRMGLACTLALLVLCVLKRKLFAVRGVWKLYALASMGIYPAMPLVYWGSQFINTGMVALIFSLSPLFTGVMSLLIFRQNPFNSVKAIALVLALVGLGLIFSDQVHWSDRAFFGVAATMLACAIMSASGVLLQRINIRVGSLEQTAGALLFSLPWFALSWCLVDPQLPQLVSLKSQLGVIYLALFGSLLGFTGYYYLLRNLSATTVSLVTLMTPVLALLLGYWIESEVLTSRVIAGVVVVIAALALYQGSLTRLIKILFRGRKRRGVVCNGMAE